MAVIAVVMMLKPITARNACVWIHASTSSRQIYVKTGNLKAYVTRIGLRKNVVKHVMFAVVVNFLFEVVRPAKTKHRQAFVTIGNPKIFVPQMQSKSSVLKLVTIVTNKFKICLLYNLKIMTFWLLHILAC